MTGSRSSGSPMPKRITPQQLAASASVGEVRTEASFRQATPRVRGTRTRRLCTLMQGEALPPVGDGERAKRWTAARRQRGKIEEQRAKDADGLATLVTDENDAGQLHERLKVTVSALLDR